MNRYSYNGPVMEFDNCIRNHWSSETLAPSIEKAKSNLTYQYKQETHRPQHSKIRLTGKIVCID